MKINYAKVKNFYSVRDLTINFDKYEGLIFVEGENRDTGASNGSGKSVTLVESVVFGLFGKTVRKGKEDAIINSEAGKGCVVEIGVNDNIRIIRKKRPTFLEFWVDGENLTGDSVTETQEKIESYLNIDYKTFLASMVFGQYNTMEFLAASPDEKRTIIRNFLNLDDLFQMRDRIRDYKSEYNNSIKSCDTLIKDKNAKIKSATKDIEKIQSLRDKFVNSSNYSEEDINALSLEDIKAREQEIEQLQSKYLGLDLAADTMETNLQHIRRKIEEGPSKREVHCDECGSLLGESVVTEQDIEDLKQDEIDVLAEQHKIDAERVEIDQLCDDLKPPIPSSEYSVIEEYNRMADKESFYEALKAELEDELVLIEENRVHAAKNYEIMRFWEVAFSEQGMISYIIRNILEYFNDRCNYYLNKISAGKYLIYFDDKLEERIFINDRKTYYMSLSGGEKKKIDFAILLTLQDLLSLTEREQSNLLFLDEFLDSLDEDSIKSIYITLQELAENKTIFCISHNNHLKFLLESGPKLKVVKENGVSTIRS